MRPLYFALASVAAAYTQQELISVLPSCALECIVQNVPETNCSFSDIGCLCESDNLWTQVYACVLPACTTRQSLTAQRVANEACSTPTRDRSLSIAVLGPTFAGIAFFFVTLRVITRCTGRESFGLGWDDFVIVAAWVLGLPKAALDPLYYKYGLGRDVWTLSFNDIDNVLRLFYIGELSYLFSVSLTKVAILAFYLRVFPSRTFHHITWTMIGVCTAFTIAFMFPLIFQCHPINYAWLRWDNERQGTCINLYEAFFSHAAFNMALDLAILIMPIPVLYKVQMTYSWRRRIHIFIMFSFGLVVTIVSIVRLDTLTVFRNSKNPTWDFWPAAVWSVIEMYVGIVCACLPAAKKFFARLLPQFLGTGTDRSALYSHDTARPRIQELKTLSTEQKSMTAPTPTTVRTKIDRDSHTLSFRDANPKRYGNPEFV